MLRSSWQTLNIGDIAHTFGALRAFAETAPEVKITLWPCAVDRGVAEELLKSFPGLHIVRGSIDANGEPDTAELEEAFSSCDVLVHGSAPAPVAAQDCRAWHEKTDKPFGFFGVSFDPWCLRGEPSWEGGILREIHAAIANLSPEHLAPETRRLLLHSR